MARDDLLTLIRERAYLLWEQAGRPDGGDLEFWERAREQVEREQAASRRDRNAETGAAGVSAA